MEREKSNCTYGNNLKSYIEYKRVNRKAKGRQLGPQQHMAPSRQDVLINSEVKCTCFFFCAFRLVFSSPVEIKQARFGEFWRPRIKWNSECTRFVCWIGVIRVRSCRFRSSVRNLVCWKVHDCRGLLGGILSCYAWLCTEMLERSFLMISFTVKAIGNHVTFRLHPKQTIQLQEKLYHHRKILLKALLENTVSAF